MYNNELLVLKVVRPVLLLKRDDASPQAAPAPLHMAAFICDAAYGESEDERSGVGAVNSPAPYRRHRRSGLTVPFWVVAPPPRVVGPHKGCRTPHMPSSLPVA